MRARRVIVARLVRGGLVAAALAACGPGTAPPEAGTGSNPPDAGSTAPDAGSSTDGGQGSDADAGDAGGIAQDGGSVDAGVQDGGSPDAGMQEGGSPGGGGPDGGVASSDCDGLVPDEPGAPAEFIWTNRDLGPGGGYCDRAETDGSGHIAL